MKLVDDGIKDLFGEIEFTPPRARLTDPEPSHQAADDAKRNVRATRKLVLLAHARRPSGLTDYELADIVGLQQNSAGKRRGDLMKAGLIEPTEERRPGPTGSSCGVYRITRDGLDWARALAQ
jgi:hypothetical protein